LTGVLWAVFCLLLVAFLFPVIVVQVQDGPKEKSHACAHI